MRRTDLLAAARDFASRLTSVLNSTVATGKPMSVVQTKPGHALVGYGVSRGEPIAQYFELNKVDGRALSMVVSYHLCLDDENSYLQVLSSVIGLADCHGRELLHFDYERNKADDYPEAHVQVAASSPAWETVSPTRALAKLHLPAGGRRFRFTLEAVAAFLIREGLASPSPGAASTIEEHQAQFDRDQLCAAIRRDPETARAFLATLESE